MTAQFTLGFLAGLLTDCIVIVIAFIALKHKNKKQKAKKEEPKKEETKNE